MAETHPHRASASGHVRTLGQWKGFTPLPLPHPGNGRATTSGARSVLRWRGWVSLVLTLSASPPPSLGLRVAPQARAASSPDRTGRRSRRHLPVPGHGPTESQAPSHGHAWAPPVCLAAELSQRFARCAVTGCRALTASGTAQGLGCATCCCCSGARASRSVLKAWFESRGTLASSAEAAEAGAEERKQLERQAKKKKKL